MRINRNRIACGSKESSAIAKTCAIIAEALEQRLFAGGMITLTATDLVLGTPDGSEQLATDTLFTSDPAPLPASSDEPVAQPPPPSLLLDPLPPEDDPLSPVGDPRPGDDASMALAASSSCSGYTITVSVATVELATEGSPIPGQFRFNATTCGTTEPPSSITVTYTLTGTARKDAPNADYAGALTSTSVVIPLNPAGSINKSGSATKDFTAIDDVIDEVSESVIVTINGSACCGTNPGYVISPGSGTATSSVEDNDIEWAEGDPIQATITASAGDDPAIPVGSTLDLRVDAFDRDRFKDNGTWYDYYDDVTSGESAADYHIVWSIGGEGKFIDAQGTRSAPYTANGPRTRHLTTQPAKTCA